MATVNSPGTSLKPLLAKSIPRSIVAGAPSALMVICWNVQPLSAPKKLVVDCMFAMNVAGDPPAFCWPVSESN